MIAPVRGCVSSQSRKNRFPCSPVASLSICSRTRAADTAWVSVFPLGHFAVELPGARLRAATWTRRLPTRDAIKPGSCSPLRLDSRSRNRLEVPRAVTEMVGTGYPEEIPWHGGLRGGVRRGRRSMTSPAMLAGIKRWKRANREKVSAHKAVARALRNGSLSRGPCVNCGSATTQAHHEDYAKRLDVIWLCAVCHKRLHRDRRHGALWPPPKT